jgi:hypothetical protein
MAFPECHLNNGAQCKIKRRFFVTEAISPNRRVVNYKTKFKAIRGVIWLDILIIPALKELTD